jgi:Leucine-rich repeat (LRR) protein
VDSADSADNARGAILDEINLFARYPKQAGSAVSAWSDRAESVRRPRSPSGQPGGTPQASRRDPLVEAFATGVVDAVCLNGRLEDDDALMVRLAAASASYADTPTASELTAGQRAQLVADLMRALTSGIDWTAAMGPDPKNAAAVYYDGLTLRNASGQPLAKVMQAIERRIERVLRARGIVPISRDRSLPRLARQIRRTLTADPTLSLHPPPDVAYGGPQWIALWTGMRTLAGLRLDPGQRSVDDVAAIGRATILERARPNAAGPGATVAPGLDVASLLLMAHAAGRIDLRAIAQGNARITARQLTAYYKEAFADELRLLDALAGLDRLQRPTGRELASANLRAAGIAPAHQIDVNALLIPAAYGPVKISIPLPFALQRQSILDCYISQDSLRLETLPPSRWDGAAAGIEIPDEAARARTRLTKSLKQQFDLRFDAYKAAVARHIAEAIDASISAAGKHRGTDVSNASITITQVRRRAVFDLFRSAYPLLPGIELDDKNGEGYLIAVETPSGKHQYFLSVATGVKVPVPPDATAEGWSRDNAHLAFGMDPPSPAPAQGLTEAGLEAAVSHEYSAKVLASGKRREIAGALKTALRATLERQRADAFGTSDVEQLRELERGLVPLRSTYLAIREGRTEDIAVTAALDALIFVPVIGEGLSLGMQTGEAAAAGVERAIGAAAERGILESIKAGMAKTASFAPALRQQAGRVLWTAARSAIFNPMDILDILRGAGALGAKGLDAVIRRLRPIRPALAGQLAKAARANGRHPVLAGRWRLGADNSVSSAPPVVPADAAAAVKGTPGEPRYRPAISEDGTRRWLQRHGRDGYAAYHPYTLAPEGPLLQADGQGTLHRSLSVEVLRRYRITDEVLRETLDRAARADGGIIMLGGKRYADVNGDYLEVLPDHTASIAQRPVWRIAGAGLPGSGSATPGLAWDKDAGLWREAQVPRLSGGGDPAAPAEQTGLPGTRVNAAHPAGHGIRLSPGDARLARFHDVLVAGIRGAATPAQRAAVRAALGRIEGDPRGKAILRAMCAYHELQGEAPSIVLREAADSPLPSPAKRPATGTVWHLDLRDTAEDNLDALVASSAQAYERLAGVLTEDSAGGSRLVRPERVFGTLLEQGRPALDPALEAAWSRWLEAEEQAGRPDAAGAIHRLRDQLREARCYGGLDKLTLRGVLLDAADPGWWSGLHSQPRAGARRRGSLVPRTDAASTSRVEQARSSAPYGLQVNLSRAMRTDTKLRSVPPLPDDVQVLHLGRNAIADWRHLPKGLRSLDISFNSLAELPIDLPAGLTELNASSNRLRTLPTTLPPALSYLNVTSNSITALPRLPDALKTLEASMNHIRVVPAELPARLEGLVLYRNNVTVLPDNLPASLRTLVVSDNGLTQLPASLPGGLVHLDAGTNRLTALPPLPDSLEMLHVSSNRLQQLPDQLPGSLRILHAENNILSQLPDHLPGNLTEMRLNNNQLTSLPQSIATLSSASIFVENNPIGVHGMPLAVGRRPGPRVFFSIQDAELGVVSNRSVGQAVRAILDGRHAEAAARWDVIEQAAEAGSQEQPRMAEFRAFLDQLRATASFRDPAFRSHMEEWLVELSKPERQSLRRTTFAICESSTATCRDRVTWTMNEVLKARLNDDILSGQYDARIGEAIEVARQMFRLDALDKIARAKVASLTGAVDELEVYLAYVVKLRAADKLALTTAVPSMRYFAVSRVTHQDLDAALRAVRERERAEFDHFLVSGYEPWQAVLKRKFGARYEKAVDELNELPFSAAFKRQVDAKLAELGLGDDADARRQAERAVEGGMRYRALAPLTREYLASAGVAYRPAG